MLVRCRQAMSYSAARYKKSSELLGQVMASSTAADGVVDRYFKAHRNMGSTDRRFAAATVYGCLRRQRELLAMIEAIAPELPDTDLTPAALLVGMYLMVNDAWSPDDFALTQFATFAAAHQGAILAFDRSRLAPAERMNLPDWLYVPLAEQLPVDDLEDLAQALSQVAAVDLRVNQRRGQRQQLLAELQSQDIYTQFTALSDFGLRRMTRGPLQNTPAFKQGWFEFQDEGSQLVSWLLQPQAGEFIVDYCAGAGGKTLHIADIMNNRGSILACDVAPRRLAQLQPRLQRAGIRNVTSRVLDPMVDDGLGDYAQTADAVLVDAPCTGSGTLRRSPDIRWREARLEELRQLQLQVLSNASQLVKAGGRLVYATCSLLAEENQQLVEVFLLANPGFAREGATFPEFDRTFTALQHQDAALAERLQNVGELQLWPHRHNTDGFYAQVLRRF